MDIEHILRTMNQREVACLLIGGVNFLLRHAPVLTFDVDLWIEDAPENLDRCEQSLADLNAHWGPSETDWKPVAQRQPGWLQNQMVFCFTSPSGAIDIFRAVRGLPSWAECRARAQAVATAGGTKVLSLSDEDMLRCQLALPEQERKLDRIRSLREILERGDDDQ